MPTTNAQRHGRGCRYVDVGAGFDHGFPPGRPRKDIKVQKDAMKAFEEKVMAFPFWTEAQQFRNSIEMMDNATYPSVHVYRELMNNLPYRTRPSVRIKRDGVWSYMPLLSSDITVVALKGTVDLIANNYWYTPCTITGNTIPKDKIIMEFPRFGFIMKPMGEDLLWEPMQWIVVFAAK